MDKIILEKLIMQGIKLKDIASKLDRSERVIGYWLNKYNLNVKRKKLCERCGEVRHDKFDSNRYTYCRWCRRTAKYKDNKLDMVNYKGGKCQKCSYEKCLNGFDFHHLDRTQKDPNWKRMRRWPLGKVKKELDKCLLVCKNCHAEIHFLEKYMLDLTNDNFDEEITNFKGNSVVCFTSNRCGPCNQLKPIIEKLSMLPNNINIRFGKIDVQENVDIASHYGISAVPTVIFFKDGALVKKLVGFQSEQVLTKYIADLSR